METLKDKTIIYDPTCPLCVAYTGFFIKIGVLEKNGRVAFSKADESLLHKLDLNRARHEIPLYDKATGEVLYGLDGLTLIVSRLLPFTAGFVTRPWFKAIIRPFYKFISYNRKLIANSPTVKEGFDCSPDYHFGWRAALALFGVGYTGLCIWLFAVVLHLPHIPLLFAAVFAYFLLLQGVNFAYHKTWQQRLDYTTHLAVLGLIEGTLFLAGATLGAVTGFIGLMFAGQGAGRLFALWLHSKRVSNNGYAVQTNIAFATGAVALITYLAYVLK